MRRVGSGHNLWRVQCLDLGLGEAQHEIRGEALCIALDSLVERLGRHSVECGELGIQQHALAASGVYPGARLPG